MKSIRTKALLACVLTAAATLAAALPASAISPNPLINTLHGQNEHISVSNPGQYNSYVFRTPTVHPSTGQFLAYNVGGRTNFTVTRTAKPTPDGPTAYPAIMRGCYWGMCSPDMKLPKQISTIRHLASTWHTVGRHSRGTYNTAYDIWIGKHRETQGHADGAELMIWLNHHGGCCAVGDHDFVRLGAHRYLFQHWLAKDHSVGKPYSGMTWNYLQFRMVKQTQKVTGLDLLRIIKYAEKRHLVKPSWWVENVQGGNEIWSGGVGLGTRYFQVSIW